MSDPVVTAIGNVATDLKNRVTKSGVAVVNFRLACHRRRYDRKSRSWIDDTPSFYTVVCWKHLADNVRHTLAKGDPIVVHGRLKITEWHDEQGRLRQDTQIDAMSIGHDLNRGTTTFTKVVHRAETVEEDTVLADLRTELFSGESDAVVVDPHTGEVYAAADLTRERSDEQEGHGQGAEPQPATAAV